MHVWSCLGWILHLHPCLAVCEFRAGEELKAVCYEDAQLTDTQHTQDFRWLIPLTWVSILHCSSQNDDESDGYMDDGRGEKSKQGRGRCSRGKDGRMTRFLSWCVFFVIHVL